MNLSDTDSESESTEDGGHEVTIEEQLLWSTLHTALTSNHWASRFKAGQHSFDCSLSTLLYTCVSRPPSTCMFYHYVLTV